MTRSARKSRVDRVGKQKHRNVLALLRNISLTITTVVSNAAMENIKL